MSQLVALACNASDRTDPGGQPTSTKELCDINHTGSRTPESGCRPSSLNKRMCSWPQHNSGNSRTRGLSATPSSCMSRRLPIASRTCTAVSGLLLGAGAAAGAGREERATVALLATPLCLPPSRLCWLDCLPLRCIGGTSAACGVSGPGSSAPASAAAISAAMVSLLANEGVRIAAAPSPSSACGSPLSRSAGQASQHLRPRPGSASDALM